MTEDHASRTRLLAVNCLRDKQAIIGDLSHDNNCTAVPVVTNLIRMASSRSGSIKSINGMLPDKISMMRSLEEGLMLTRFYSKRKPEKKMFQVKLETRQLVWSKNIGQGKAEGIGKRPH